jgi:hypothetical protein
VHLNRRSRRRRLAGEASNLLASSHPSLIAIAAASQALDALYGELRDLALPQELRAYDDDGGLERQAIYQARSPLLSLRGWRAFFVSIQKLEVTSGELLLFAQALGHAGLHERTGRDPLKHVVVPREQLAQLRPNVGLRELRRHRQESTTKPARRPPEGPAGRRVQPEARP